MALLLMCGLPASGKSTLTHRLDTLLQADGHTVHIIRDGDDALPSSSNSTEQQRKLSSPPPNTNETPTFVPQTQPHIKISRRTLYASSAHEKQLRARLRTAAERALSHPSAIVIVDSTNYIKGFRYELFCAAKTAGAAYAVIHARAPEASCALRDAAREAAHEDAYGQELLHALMKRFEAPNSANRWDSPLFIIDVVDDMTPPDEENLQVKPDTTIDAKLQQVVASLGSGGGMKRLHATLATKSAPVPGADVLAMLDAVTRRAETDLISQLQAGVAVGQAVTLRGASQPIRFQRKPRVAELREWRRAYINYSRLHPPVVDGGGVGTSEGKLLEEYVAFINEQLRTRRY